MTNISGLSCLLVVICSDAYLVCSGWSFLFCFPPCAIVLIVFIEFIHFVYPCILFSRFTTTEKHFWHYLAFHYIMAQSNDHWPLKHSFRIGHLNINHIVNKMADVTEIVQNSQNTGRDFHMFCFSESRLNDHKNGKNVSVAGFHIIRKYPLDRKETGLVV